MDYGIKLFRHVVDQVFGNLGAAARISVVPALIIAAVSFWAFGSLSTAGPTIMSLEEADVLAGLDADTMAAIMAAALRGLVVALVGAVLFGWLAVAWHRYVLTEEMGGLVPMFSPARVFGYLGWSILIGLVLFLVMIPILLVFGGLATISFGFALLLGVGVNILLSWMFVRCALVLPARAIDQPLNIQQSWQATKDVSGEILVPIVGFAVIFALIVQSMDLFPANLVTTLLSAAVYWIQMLVNLALLTTLYGNRIEGRALN
ncbi:MAG: hypothetical protein AAGA70_01475 [Pseudomonadota bacterium]